MGLKRKGGWTIACLDRMANWVLKATLPKSKNWLNGLPIRLPFVCGGGSWEGRKKKRRKGRGRKKKNRVAVLKKLDDAAIDLFFTKYSQVTENFVKKSCWACSLKSRGYHVESIFHFLTELGLVNKSLANH